MAGVGTLVRAELRRRWLALVLLGVLAGAVGATVVTAVVGARRSDTAFDRAVAAQRPGDAYVSLFRTGSDGAVPKALASLPFVETAWIARQVVAFVEGDQRVFVSVVSGPRRPSGFFQPRVIAGRLPDDDAADEVVALEDFAEASGIGLGDRLPVTFLAPDEFERFDTGFGAPDGPRLTLRVVGVVRLVGAASGFQLPMLGTPAFHDRYSRLAGGSSVVPLELGRGADDVPRLRTALEDLRARHDTAVGSDFAFSGVSTLRAAADASGNASRVVIAGFLAFAVAALVAGCAALAQMTTRHHARVAAEQPTLAALGLTRRERVIATVSPAVVAALPVAAVVTVAGTVLASPLTPIGSPRRLEPNPGFAFNATLTATATAALLVVFAAIVSGSGARSVRRRGDTPPRRAPIAERLGRVGGRPVVVTGVRFALERGAGRTAVPVRAALAGAVIAVAGVVGVGSFAASLDRLRSTPARYGFTADVQFVDVTDDDVASLVDDPTVRAVVDVRNVPVDVGGIVAPASGYRVVKGSFAFTLLDGRMPASPDEVAVGPEILDETGTSLGGRLEVRTSEGRRSRPVVVGRVLAPGEGPEDYDRSAVFTSDGLDRLGGGAFRQAYVVFRDDATAERRIPELGRDLELTTAEPPTTVVNLSQLGRLPALLAAFLATLGGVALGNAVVVAVHRRRPDLALLRCIGFTPRQTAGAIRTMAAVTASVGLVLGVPLGLVAGRLVWGAVASGIHVAPDAALPTAALALVAPAAFTVALAAAALPARRAGSLRPAVALRSE